MIERWKQVWRETVDSFWRELDGARAGGGRAAGTLRGELDSARAQVRRLEAEVRRIRGRLDEERAAERRCRRRAEMARGIDDAETERIAERYAARHAEHRSILERKIEATRAQLALYARELREMEALAEQAEPAGDGAPTRPDGAHADAAVREIDPLEDPVEEDFRRMEEAARRRAAERAVDDLRRRTR